MTLPGVYFQINVKVLSYKELLKNLPEKLKKEESLRGFFYPEKNTIFILSTLDEHEFKHVLAHEWSHAIFHQLGFGFGSEHQADSFSIFLSEHLSFFLRR